ncbi:MAG: tRNA pseudouridine(13) synthase TruD [Theionarchaea archaeon]|nr:tRNA pseudouridine(13) synthase TruD [Theionarchaea archaeon]MBU6999521.1 tRNA pseudouridine(13) synthase TruD [Theionarchaea archaeon]MBU7020315.1 tRNA pseudouridine(13) synthase TruD [Theionarchaea archaeon]MBU7035553.1 tRNA pseudouridine(13) synthase TruD [Theionarchaea archaeon]MBU7041183.1 tRNA pseudouridine(13) synthase TruD [Theionarchaea archaeon]
MRIKEKPEDFVVEEVIDIAHAKNDCLVCTLEKRGWDTIGIVKVLARKLGISQKRIGFAGLKDRQAVTRQKISVSGVDRKQLESVRIPRVSIIDIELGDRIRLGDHKGNQFTIMVRDASVSPGAVEKIKGGFPNYFGIQRFGEVRPITHEVGRELVRGDLDTAAFVFLAKPFEKEKYFEVRKELWETHDFEKARSEYPLSLRYERAMLENIGKGAKKAFEALPRRLNTLFIHAYQAYIFNEIVRRRSRAVPITAVEPGDVVIDWVGTRRVVTLAGEHNMDKITERGLCAAAPIVGYKTHVRGRIGEITQEILEEEGIGREDFRLREFPSLASRGTHREIAGKAQDISYTCEEGGTRIRFFLPKGEYATVFLEELFG